MSLNMKYICFLCSSLLHKFRILCKCDKKYRLNSENNNVKSTFYLNNVSKYIVIHSKALSYLYLRFEQFFWVQAVNNTF